MLNNKMVKIAFLQRVLPLYRLGFYKALSAINYKYHFTLFCEQGNDNVKNIETISPELFDTHTRSDMFEWRNTETFCYHRAKILFQKGILGPILRKEFDVLMLSNRMTHLFYWVIIFCCKIKGIKIIFWSHGLQGHEKGLKLWMKRFHLNLADLNLVYANYNKKFMVERGINRKPIQVVYNSLDFNQQNINFLKIIKQDRNKLKKNYVENNFPILLFVSRLLKAKKVDLLLKAVFLLKNKGQNVNLLIVGDGPELDALKLVTKNLGLCNLVYFIGRVYEESRLVEYFYVSDLFVSPGEVGLNCIHSLSYGVPVITHKDFRYQNPEVEAIVENETGLFFEKDNVEDLAEKILIWLSAHSKEESAEKARNRIKKFYSPMAQAKCVLDGISMLYNNSSNLNF